MTSLLRALDTGKNGQLESPTGTGKTLCQLCATLGWQRYTLATYGMDEEYHRGYILSIIKEEINNNIFTEEDNLLSKYTKYWNYNFPILSPKIPINIPFKILYTSRTHSQLSQAIEEQKNTYYSKNIKANILGSRNYLCNIPSIVKSSESKQRYLCATLCSNGKCSYYINLKKQSINETVWSQFPTLPNICDIEDMNMYGNNERVCSYYLSMDIALYCDILFVPYNYILDSITLKNKKLSEYLLNSIIIFDEGHNIEETCTSLTSFILPLSLLNNFVIEIRKSLESTVLNNNDSYDDDDDDDDDNNTVGDTITVDTLLLVIRKLNNKLETMCKKLLDTNNSSYIITTVDTLFEIFKDCGITSSTYKKYTRCCKKIYRKYSTTTTNTNSIKTLRNSINDTSSLVVHDILIQIFKLVDKERYRIIITSIYNNNNVQTYNIELFCLSASVAMEILLQYKYHNIILTSGTLTPIENISNELNISFPIVLCNTHIINTKKQLCSFILENGVNSIPLYGTFNNRSNITYLNSLGLSILNILRQIPSGILVFFPSYTSMEKTLEYWGYNNKISTDSLVYRMQQYKHIFIEPRINQDFITIMQEFRQILKDSNNTKGAVFFGVCRGKASEGYDFTDELARAVIIIGIPFANTYDPKVQLKVQYWDKRSRELHNSINGRKWMFLNAFRAINQAIGRVIRHRQDYGVIILADIRFKQDTFVQYLSNWLRDELVYTSHFGSFMTSLVGFFRIQHASTAITTNNDSAIDSNNINHS